MTGIHDSNDLRARIQDIARNCDPPVKVLVEPVGKVMVCTSARAMPSRCNAATASSGGRAR